MFGSKDFANSSREATRSVRTIGVHPAACAARAVTRPIGPAPLYISEDPEGVRAVVMTGWSDPVIYRLDVGIIPLQGGSRKIGRRGHTKQQQDHPI